MMVHDDLHVVGWTTSPYIVGLHHIFRPSIVDPPLLSSSSDVMYALFTDSPAGGSVVWACPRSAAVGGQALEHTQIPPVAPSLRVRF